MENALAIAFGRCFIASVAVRALSRRVIAGRVVAGLMFVLWLGTVSAAILPHLHLVLHKDARNAHHTCLLTQVQEQGIWSGSEVFVVALPVKPLGKVSHASEVEHYPSRDYRIAPSRAPPVSFCFPTVVG